MTCAPINSAVSCPVAEERAMDYERVLVVRDVGWRAPTLTGLLLTAGFVLWVWQYVLIVALAAGLLWLLYRGLRQEQEIRARERAERDALVERADAQHNLVMQGDPRGTYGEGYEEPAAPAPKRAPCPKAPDERQRIDG